VAFNQNFVTFKFIIEDLTDKEISFTTIREVGICQIKITNKFIEVNFITAKNKTQKSDSFRIEKSSVNKLESSCNVSVFDIAVLSVSFLIRYNISIILILQLLIF